MEVRTPGALLFASGQIGEDTDGHVPDDAKAECRQAWRNVLAQLDAAGYGPGDLVRATVYLTGPDLVRPHQEARNEALGPVQPTLTVVVVSALADPRWHVEVVAMAARPTAS